MTDVSIDDLIDGLADDLKPIRPRRLLRGGAWTAAAWLIGGGTLLWLLGMRHDLAHGASMAPMPMFAFWLIVALGLAATWSALRMGLPGVGRDYSGWRWAGLAALALPLTALVVDGLVAGLGVGAALFAWLKGGAPTSLERAGWVVGVAAGAAGAAVLALHCSSDNMVHIALWHGLVVILSAIAGRLILPPLLRW